MGGKGHGAMQTERIQKSFPLGRAPELPMSWALTQGVQNRPKVSRLFHRMCRRIGGSSHSQIDEMVAEECGESQQVGALGRPTQRLLATRWRSFPQLGDAHRHVRGHRGDDSVRRNITAYMRHGQCTRLQIAINNL